ncbi:MAG: VIT domain-containing protein [Planctomycetota bacterium]
MGLDRRLVLGAALSVLLATSARAQDATPRAERREPALLVRPDPSKPSQPLRVAGVAADVTVVSGIASVRLDLTFENPLDRILEGELVLPLPPGASVTSMALEIDGELREASVVERERARAIFEEVVRGNADPALLEWVKGNVFRTRVYPIPAKGTKRVVLGFEHPLADSGAATARLTLPLAYGTKIRSFSCKVTAIGEKAPASSKDGLPLRFERAGPGFQAELKGSEVMEMEPRDLVLDVALPLEGSEVVVEKASVTKDLVFVARVAVPEIPAAKLKPARVTILWDASGSAAKRDRAAELAFIESYAKRLGDATVKLVVFSNAVWAIDKDAFAIKEGKCAELVETLRALPADGATHLGCLDLKKLDADTEQFLLFSDGFANWGTTPLVAGEKPVTCVVASEAADFALLERVSSKGALIHLTPASAADAVERALAEPRTLLSVDAVGGAGDGGRVLDVFPKAPAKLTGRTVTISGRFKAGAPQKLVLRFGHGATESAKVEITLDSSTLAETGRLERIWASRRVDSLLEDKVSNEDEITRFAKAHALVTPFTSLLVLETLDQYVRYRVKPPAKWIDEWEKRIESEKQAAAKSRDQRIEEVRAKWKARVEWSKTDFKYPDDLKVSPEKTKNGGSGARNFHRSAESDDAPRAAPREAAPAPEAPAGQAMAKKAEESKDDAGGSSGPSAPPPGIKLKAWDPNTPYIEAFKKVTDKKALYAAYLAQRASYTASTAFYLDSADYFYGQKETALALRILSNLAELELESAPLLRILGHRLAQSNELDLSAAIFTTVARMRPEEPQSWRDLGLVLAEAKRWSDSIANLEKVVLGHWDGRFPDIDLIALGEMNDVIRRAGAKSGTTLPEDLLTPIDVDMRIILTWDADACDMDLWVVEPSGEKAFYGNHLTKTGGSFGQDFTQGYGPEEYLVKKAMKGTFKIQINYYGNRQQLLAGDTTI